MTLSSTSYGVQTTRIVTGNYEVEEEPIMMSGQPEVSKRTKRKAEKFGKDLKNGRLRKHTNHALDAIIKLGAYKLKRVGHKKEGDQMLKEWKQQYSLILEDRGITDHAPLSKWLADKTLMMEFILGHQVMHSLRLDDLITLNFGLPVVISCIDKVDEQEYFNHFVHDEIHDYRGVGPVVIYWVSFFSCVGFTWGSGFLFCSPVAMGTEYLTDSIIAPKLNPTLWKMACKPGEEYASDTCVGLYSSIDSF